MSDQIDQGRAASSAKEPDLTRLEFSQPQCRFESIATYKNGDQEFRIIVTGLNEEEVLAYVKDISVFLQVLPDKSFQPEEEVSKQQEEEREAPTQESIDMTIEVVNSGGIAPPYVVDFVIDPVISQNFQTPHTHNFLCRRINVRITDNQGEQTAFLKRGGVIYRSAQRIDDNPQTALPGFAVFPGTSSGDFSTLFSLVVTGTGAYTLTGQYAL